MASPFVPGQNNDVGILLGTKMVRSKGGCYETMENKSRSSRHVSRKPLRSRTTHSGKDISRHLYELTGGRWNENRHRTREHTRRCTHRVSCCTGNSLRRAMHSRHVVRTTYLEITEHCRLGRRTLPLPHPQLTKTQETTFPRANQHVSPPNSDARDVPNQHEAQGKFCTQPGTLRHAIPECTQNHDF